MALTDSDRQWYNLPQNVDYFITPGPNGGTAQNLTSASEGTVFRFPSNPGQYGLEGYPNTFLLRKGHRSE